MLESNVSEFALKETLDTLRHVRKSPATPSLHGDCRFNAFTAFPVRIYSSTYSTAANALLPNYDNQRRIGNKFFAVFCPKKPRLIHSSRRSSGSESGRRR